MVKPLQAPGSEWIETFRCRSRVDLHPGWWRRGDQERRPVLAEPWGRHHRPDWAERGLLIWPRGGNRLHLEQTLVCPKSWTQASASCERLVLSWWADAVRLRVDGVLVHEGDLFDTAAVGSSLRIGGEVRACGSSWSCEVLVMTMELSFRALSSRNL